MRSILQFDAQATFHVLALDEGCAEVLAKAALPNVSVTRLEELEAFDPELAAVKSTRTAIEYYFTCTPCFPRYLLAKSPGIDIITYLDADLCFYADPQLVFDEIGDASVAITPHRFSPDMAAHAKFGAFNVGWVSWRNDETGRQCLEDYRADCLAWCHDRLEGDRFADQKYLDKWPSRYRGVKIIDHPGVNAAVWNVRNSVMYLDKGRVMLSGAPLVFWHFHAVKQNPDGGWRVSLSEEIKKGYPLVLDRLLRPYLAEVMSVRKILEEKFGYVADGREMRPLSGNEVEMPPPQGTWKYAGAAWPAGMATGWDAAELQAVREEQWRKLQALPAESLAGETPHERKNVLAAFQAIQEARQKCGAEAPLRVLDWGGDVGFLHYRLRRIHPEIDVAYTIKEVPPLCELGRRLQPEVRFVERTEELDARYDLAIASAAIHYGADWRAALAELAARADRLLIARQPTVQGAASYVARQGAYGTVFTCWILNEGELQAEFAAHGLRVVWHEPSGDAASIAGAPEQPIFRSYFLMRA